MSFLVTEKWKGVCMSVWPLDLKRKGGLNLETIYFFIFILRLFLYLGYFKF